MLHRWMEFLQADKPSLLPGGLVWEAMVVRLLQQAIRNTLGANAREAAVWIDAWTALVAALEVSTNPIPSPTLPP